MAGEYDPRKKTVKQRTTSGKEIPPSPVLRRMGRRTGAGADTPAGPDTQRSPEPAKQEREDLGTKSPHEPGKATGESP